MRFQGLSVVLGKKRWPELVARQRKNDFGLDAYAPSNLASDGIGKGLAASITPTLKKISEDAEKAKKNFPDLRSLLFVTSAKVGNTDRKRWEETIYKDYGLELHIIEREEIITLMMMPENASLCASFLGLDSDAEPRVEDLIERTRCAAAAVTRTWASKTKGFPLIDLAAVRLDNNGGESSDVLSLADIDRDLSQSRRVVLEGPAGRGKTTTLVQLAQRARGAGIPIMIELPAWTSSRRAILEFVAGIPAFQAQGLTAGDLARVQQAEPFLLLLNGWNEISESNSAQASEALRELERDFPSAGIIVATRTHHLTPPLPGALRLRLLRLRREQRTAYLTARLSARTTQLRARIDADPALDELTRAPFILSEVASLFEGGAEIPSTKLGVLAQVIYLHETRDEHKNALRAAPVFDRQLDYLKALATEMTRRGAVSLPEADARAATATVARKLVDGGQIEMVAAPAILATLTAHHVLERIDYPQTEFQFEHQQLQEYYAALDICTHLLALREDDHEAIRHFAAIYINDPTWAEPLRMIAATFAEKNGNDGIDDQRRRAGVLLVKMALATDPVFAGELVRLCGAAIWHEVRTAVGERLRAIHASQDRHYQQYALVAMLATGMDDFRDIIVPLLSAQDHQTRLGVYRLWPDFEPSSLGENWRELVRSWSEEAREDFVSELLHHRVDGEIAAFAAEDDSSTVKKAAISGLMWTESDDMLANVIESMDAETFEEVALKDADRMPTAIRPKVIAAMLKFIGGTPDHLARLRIALGLVELGELGMDGIIKDAMLKLSDSDTRSLTPYVIQPALELMSRIDPAWTSEWIATKVAESVLYGHENWLPFATAIPEALVEKYLQFLESEDFSSDRSLDGMIAVVTARGDANLAARVFVKLRELQRKVDASPGIRHEREWEMIRRLEAVFLRLPDDSAATGILSFAVNGDPLDIKIAADLLNRVARSDVEPLRIVDDDVRANLRDYLKNSVDVVLRQDDFRGQEKANLASSIAQVGQPEDMTDLVRLIRADIDRVRRGRAARATGNRGPLSDGSVMSYARWHISAILHLDAVGAASVLVDLISEPEYLSDVAAAMARDFVPKSEHSFGRSSRHDLMWAAREGRTARFGDEQRRTQFATALHAEISRLQGQTQDEKPAAGMKDLANALAAVDGHGSDATVFGIIALPGQWDHYTRLDAAERLLMAGVALPAITTFALVDSILDRTERWLQESDRYLLRRALVLCPFVDDPASGIAKMREVLRRRQLRGYELREVVTALGDSRSDMAIDLLNELATDPQIFEQCEDNFISAFASLDTLRSRALLLGVVDPDIPGITLTRHPRREDLLVMHLAEQAQRNPEDAARLRELCGRDLPELSRHILSKVMARLGTPEALTANLNLIDDSLPSPVPHGVWNQLRSAFVERRPYGQESNVFTEHAHASNELRARLFRMATEDQKRRKAAGKLLVQIEVWRVEHGRPTDEPRHPDFASGLSWPPQQF